jgi:hypothetical protein
MDRGNDGVVFTKEWVVELMLDNCGYLPTADLTSKLVIEPSCGQGAFLMPIVRRLLSSMERYKHKPSELSGSIRAFEIDRGNVLVCREKLSRLLAEHGVSGNDAGVLLDEWLIESDYLLCDSFYWADFVVGNPPYIRGTEIEPGLRRRYIKAWQAMTAGTDIYVGFIEMGLRYLKPDGVLSYICADRWMHNAYGRKLRRMVADRFSVERVFEMHGVDAFENEVSAYPAIIQIRNARQAEVACAEMAETFTDASVPVFMEWLERKEHRPFDNGDFEGYWLDGWFDSDVAWPFAPPGSIDLLNRLNEQYDPLQNEGTETIVGIGIATGRDDVFVIEDPTLIEEDLLLPLVTSRQIKDGRIDRKDTWLFNPWDDDGSLIDLDSYPLAKGYLEKHSDELRSRHIAKKGGQSSWYRTIDKVYPGLAAKPKLLIQDMKSCIQPVLDKGGHYPHHNLYWITSNRWDLEVLGGLLISDIVRTIVEAYCVKMRGGTLRLQAQYLRKIRLPDPDSLDASVQDELRTAFRNNDRSKADAAARKAYRLERMSA